MLAVSSTTAMGFAPVTAPVRQPRADVRMETMSDLDALAQKLNPKVGFLGEYSLSDPTYLILIGLFKLVAISVTVLAGYRGGFIFPFMFAGLALGTRLATF